MKLIHIYSDMQQEGTMAFKKYGPEGSQTSGVCLGSAVLVGLGGALLSDVMLRVEEPGS